MFRFENLDEVTRRYMLMEVEEAIKTSQLHLSRRFTAHGRARYPDLLREAVRAGNEGSLTTAMEQQQCFAEREPYGAGTRRVPGSAASTFAAGEFNAFYMRGVCHRAIQEGCPVEVYRAKEAATTRSSSRLVEGQRHDPKRALLLFRNSPSGSHRGPNMPAGSNSGLSLRLCIAT
ncbi:hypothetical protein GCM10023172_42410 [Hymenobacter ginsengisoli]|uniref:Uncharacterized protein n=1 Tax=Hymenobacter ginsengisoli TaxID=1051626 RepID=A0ABP8QTC1_9BACT